MTFQLTSSKLTGTPDGSGWTQVHEFRPEDSEKLKNRGTLFAVISTNKPGEGINGVVYGREVISRLHEEYYGKSETSAFYALKNAVSKLSSEFKEELGTIEIAAVVCVGDVIYSAAYGGSKVLIYRDAMLAEILDSKQNVVSASGYPKDGDILVCASRQFLDQVPQGALKAAIAGKDVIAAAEQIAPSIHSLELQGKLGAVLINFSKGERKPFLVKDEKKSVQKNEFSEQTNKKGIGIISKLTKLPKKVANLPKKRIYVRPQTENLEDKQSKKTAFTVGFVILVLLIVSIFYGIRQKNQNEFKENYEVTFQSAKHEFEEALELYSLNPQRARELFVSSKAKASSLVDQGIEDDELNNLWISIQEREGLILGEYNIAALLFVDLLLQTDDFNGSDLAVSNETLFVLDKDSEKALSVEIENKKTKILAGPSLIDNAKYIAAYSDRAFILSEDNVFEIGDEKRDLIEKDWEGSALPYAYTGNFYILDKQENDVYRYPGSGLNFSEKKSWLKQSDETDFGNVISWMIDGNIWMLTDDGGIMRFSLGNRINFTVSGVSPPFISPTQIFSNEELNHLYILDPENERVVVLTKDGEFKAQYVEGVIKNATDFGVSEKHNKIILLTPGKLMEIELKHQ